MLIYTLIEITSAPNNSDFVFSVAFPVSRHREVMGVSGKKPVVGKEALFIAPSANIVGDVNIADNTGIFYGAVVNGSIAKVVIGENSMIKDRAVLAANIPGASITIGKNVMVGSGAVIGAATVEDDAHVGMGVYLGDGVVVKSGAYVAPGSVVAAKTIIPARQVI